MSVHELKRLRRIYNGKIRRPVDLLVIALRIAANPFQLQINKEQVVFAAQCATATVRSGVWSRSRGKSGREQSRS